MHSEVLDNHICLSPMMAEADAWFKEVIVLLLVLPLLVPGFRIVIRI